MRNDWRQDSNNRVVVHFPIWLRVFGGFGSLLFGAMSAGLASGIGEDTASLVLFICVGLPLIFACIYLLGYTSQFIFDDSNGNMTIRKSVARFIYRSWTFSRREVLDCVVREETPEPDVAWSITLWRVAVRTSIREKDLKIIVNNEKIANYVVDKVRTFMWFG